MIDFPPGEWSPLLVGDQWPDAQDVLALQHGKTNRGMVKTGYQNFADILRNAQTGPLADQHGHTADDLRNSFAQGENLARQVAEKNGIKEGAYSTSYDSIQSLRHDLTSLAEEGNKQIKDIQDSKEPVEVKVTQIVAAVNQYRALSNLAAAKYSGNVLDAMQRILDAEGTGQSARQFAQAHGLDVGQMFRQPNEHETLQNQVRSMLNGAGSSTGLPGNAGTSPAGFATSQGGDGPPTGIPANVATAPQPLPAPGPPVKPTSTNGIPSNLRPQVGPPPGAPLQAGLPAGSVNPPVSGPGMAGAPIPSSGLSTPGTGSMPSSGMGPLTGGTPMAPTGPVQGTTPAQLMQSFDQGLQTGAPLSNAAGAIPPPQMAPADPAAATTPSAGVSAPVTAQAFDAPPPVAHTPTPDATPAPQVVAGPATTGGSVVAAPPPSGPLPAYASDIRPSISAATAPSAPPSAPPSTTPASAPVHPTAGQATPAQPTVVRREAVPVPPSSPSSLGSQAVAATATGAVAGAASANATARARLQRLVFAVARQQPRLAWAAGDRPDNTTVLATDLASGWIPPGIDLPSAVKLLPPERRRGDLEALLGEVGVAAGYTPIHHIPEDDEPVVTSPRARRLPDIDELGWELNQATQWRDGLPRLAHTLAKAASAGTGVLDKEVDQLHDHLATISARVLDNYPDHVDPNDIGNWQLLAAIDALINRDKTSANYHLAWFKACSTTTIGQR